MAPGGDPLLGVICYYDNLLIASLRGVLDLPALGLGAIISVTSEGNPEVSLLLHDHLLLLGGHERVLRGLDEDAVRRPQLVLGRGRDAVGLVGCVAVLGLPSVVHLAQV